MIKSVSLPQPLKENTVGSAGFTLLELTIVLFILALILAGLLTPLATRLEQQDRKTTRLMLEEIRASLLGYTIINGHLPCADCLDGSADCSAVAAASRADGMEDVLHNGAVSTRQPGVVCATETGGLPWATLGVPQADAWGQTFIYSVDGRFADSRDGQTGEHSCQTEAQATASVSFCLSSKGDMTIRNTGVFVDKAAGGQSQVIAQDIPVLVFSPGANGPQTQARMDDGSISEHERRNWWLGRSDTDRTFVADEYVGDEQETYDDIMIWISIPSLMYRMISAERLP